MKAEYFVIEKNRCPVCEGDGLLSGPYWDEYSQENGNPVEFFRARGFDVHCDADLPPEEVPCDACGGSGLRESEVPLAAALAAILGNQS